MKEAETATGKEIFAEETSAKTTDEATELQEEEKAYNGDDNVHTDILWDKDVKSADDSDIIHLLAQISFNTTMEISRDHCTVFLLLWLEKTTTLMDMSSRRRI